MPVCADTGCGKEQRSQNTWLMGAPRVMEYKYSSASAHDAPFGGAGMLVAHSSHVWPSASTRSRVHSRQRWALGTLHRICFPKAKRSFRWYWLWQTLRIFQNPTPRPACIFIPCQPWVCLSRLSILQLNAIDNLHRCDDGAETHEVDVICFQIHLSTNRLVESGVDRDPTAEVSSPGSIFHKLVTARDQFCPWLFDGQSLHHRFLPTKLPAAT